MCGLRIEADATDRMRQATAPTRAAADGPSVRMRRVAEYSVNGVSKRTILPFASAARRSSSSNEATTSTGAVMPALGVPMLPPSPSMTSRAARGLTKSTDSAPRTQRGTITGSPRTFSSPSAFIWPRTQSIAASRLAEPLSRLPNVSTSRPSRS